MKQRTLAYAFTADPMSVVDMEKIALLRKVVSNMNKSARLAARWNVAPVKLKRVCLKARLGKDNPAAAKYRHQWIKSIKLEDAARIDVYIQDRRDESMKFRKTKPVNGTSLKGYVTTTYDDLVRVFGEPSYGPDDCGDKTTCEWNLKFRDGTVATIYDWKEFYTPRDEHRWHIGGFDNKSVDRVYEVMGIR